MVIINLNKESNIPLYRQVISQLIRLMENETLNSGDKLPSTRSFSKQLGINRTTIYRAYQELWALGYIESRSGSYSFVRKRREFLKSLQVKETKAIDWKNHINPNVENVFKRFGDFSYPFREKMEKFDGFDFGRLHPDTRIFPVSQFKKSLNKIILERGESILDYGSSMGYLPLREHIARRMQLHSIPVKPEEILITSGAQNAIDLLLKLFIKPNAKVLVEAPTYGMIIPALQFYGFEIISIPMKRSGVDLFYLEEKLKNEKYSFFYTMPNFQNPTGITTSQSHREKLLALCEKFSVPIIEDAYEEEMKYFGKVPMPIKSMDSKQIVIYVGSFSKILFPGIRLGWVAADKECIARLVNLKRFGDISSAMPEQAALANFCMNGEYELHIKKLHKIYRARMSLAIKTLKTITKSFKNIVWQEPNGGFTIWIELKKIKKSYEEIDTILKSFRIRVALGQDFYVEPVREIYLRLAIASLDDVEIVNGLKQLERAISKIYSK